MSYYTKRVSESNKLRGKDIVLFKEYPLLEMN